MRQLQSTLRRATLSIAVVLASVGAASAHSLKDALASAYINSGLLEQNRALQRATDENVAQALAALRPVVSWSVATSRNFRQTVAGADTAINQSISLTSQMLVYDFGRGAAAVEAAKANVLSTRHSLVNIEQQVLLSAVAAYMNVRAERSAAELQRNNLRLLREELRAARERFEVGEITRTDVAFAEARVAQSEALLAGAEAGVASAEAAYQAAIGEKPGSLPSPPNVPRGASSESEARAIARSRHPNILAGQQNVTAAELNIRRAELSKMPSLTLQGSVGAQRGDPSANVETGSIGLQLSGPIYQGGQLASVKRQAAAQRDASRAALRLAAIAVEQNVADAWASLEAADATLRASREQVRAAQTAFNGIREEARLGSRTTLDVLDAEQELLNARSSVISAETMRQVAGYQLLASMGLLTAERLKLDVPLYDAAAYYDLARSAPVPSSSRGQQLDDLMERLNRN